MTSNFHLFRSCVADSLTKAGRKIWPFLYLDLQFIQLGIKKAILFDYVDVAFEDLVSLVSKMKSRCIDDVIASELVVMKVGGSSFIFNYSKFLEYLAEVELIYFDSHVSTSKRGIIADVSISSSNPKELDDKCELEELRKVIEEIRRKLLALKVTNSHSFVVLSDSKEKSWCTVFGIILNYPIVYWLNSENSNLVGENLINYKVEIKDTLLFGINIPKNYIVLSFTVPEVLISMYGEEIVLQWFSSLNETVKLSSSICPSIYLQRLKVNGFQTTL